MASILLKGVPHELHARLKRQAAKIGRSMNRHAVILLQESLRAPIGSRGATALPPPCKARDPRTGRAIKLTRSMIRKAIHEGRG